jgi:hypothetical protein
MQLILCRRLEVWIAYVLFHRNWLVIINGPFLGWFRNWQVLTVKHWSDGGRQRWILYTMFRFQGNSGYLSNRSNSLSNGIFVLARPLEQQTAQTSENLSTILSNILHSWHRQCEDPRFILVTYFATKVELICFLN